MFKKFHAFVALCASVVGSQVWAQETYSVLAYHSVVDESAPKEQRLYVSQTISASQLINHFNWFKNNGYNVVSWQQVVDAEKGKTALPPKSVVLSFDDGYETMYSVIFPLLKAYNYPAVFAPVTSWIDTPAGGKITYGNTQLDRSKFFTTWAQINEMRRSGLVEIASHTYDLHHGVVTNPGGSQLPAMITPIYKNGQYESEAQYKARLAKDLQRSSSDIAKRIGIAPRIIVWPYGAFNETSVAQAKGAKMPYHFTLREKINKVGDAHVGRFLIDAESDFGVMKAYLDRTVDPDNKPTVQRALQIRLDEVYDPNPTQFAKNYDALISRVFKSGATSVYLAGFSDPDQDGVIDSVYFPTKVLPVKADLFSQVAWQLRSRAGVKVYAWLPSSLDNLPVSARNENAMKTLFKDLSFYAKFDGVFFDDHLNPNQWAKSDAQSIQLTLALKEAMLPYFYWGEANLKMVRNVNPQAVDFSQTFAKFAQTYHTVLVSASSEESQDIQALINTLNQEGVAKQKMMVGLSDVNPTTQAAIPNAQLMHRAKALEKAGLMNVSYRFNHFLTDEKVLNEMKPYISSSRDITRN